MAASGVTSFQPTLISLPETAYLAALEHLAAVATDQARVLGMHLEYPSSPPCVFDDAFQIVRTIVAGKENFAS
jgi:hypothetical protein